MRRGRAYAIAAAGLVLAACAPMPVETAQNLCRAEIAPKAPISGEGRMGVTSDGFESGMELSFNLGRGGTGDPSEVYKSCVVRRSGQLPTRPYWDAGSAGRP